MKELDALYETIKDRKENKEEGSYTTSLFEKGLEKILTKVGEECTEVVIASLTQKMCIRDRRKAKELRKTARVELLCGAYDDIIVKGENNA